MPNKLAPTKIAPTKIAPDKLASGKGSPSTLASDKLAPARMAALAVLERLYKHTKQDDAPLPQLMDAECQRRKLDSRDAALLAELVYGVLRQEQRLALTLRPLLKKPEKLPPVLRLILLMGTCELLCLNSVPPRATVDQSVALTRKRLGKNGAGMAGLVNATLRNLARALSEHQTQATEHFRHDLQSKKDCCEKPLEQTDALKENTAKTEAPPQHVFAAAALPQGDKSAAILSAPALALGASLPLWLAQLWIDQYGEQAQDFALNATQRPPACYRINAARPQSEQQGTRQALLEAGATPYGPYGFYSAKKLPDTICAPLEKAGSLSRQGLASQSVALAVRDALLRYAPSALLPATPQQTSPHKTSAATLWDACCGRGGKSCALLELGIPVVLSSDPSGVRLTDFSLALARLGLPAPQIRQASSTQIRQEINAGTLARFSFILADAPCSGTGTLPRNPELRLRLSPARLEEARRLQSTILEDVWDCLLPDGLLFYTTCALNKAENEDQMSALQGKYPQATLLEQTLLIPSEGSGHDSLFMAILRKNKQRGRA